MKNILIGIPSTREDELFLSSLDKFCDEIGFEYLFEKMVVKNQPLAVAQNLITEYFLSKDFTHLLFLDDDHWGHSLDMLNCLINADTYMATVKSYSRHYPYPSALMRKSEAVNNQAGFVGIENESGYMEIDLSGFPMTLLKRELFHYIDRPFFRESKTSSRPWATDEEFCHRLNRAGIKPMGCFQHCLGHDKVSEQNVKELRQKEISQNSNFVLMNLHKYREEQLKEKWYGINSGNS